jgi:type IV secretion system protein VirB11
MSSHEAARQLRHLLAPLDGWRLDPHVDEIAINQPFEVFVRSGGRFVRHDVDIDYDHAFDIAVLAGALNQQNVSEANPLLAADLPDGERLQAVLPPCVPQGTVSLTIRVHGSSVAPLADAAQRYNLDKWNRWQQREEAKRTDNAQLLAAYDSGDIVQFFEEVVRLKFSPILCGHVGSGKTTMLKTMMSVIHPDERIITIENALELDIVNQPNHVRLLYSHGGQGVARITQKDLLEAYLRMRPDRGCVGELRDPEAAYTYVSECMTGHPGSPSTIHGRDAPQAATRLFNLFKASEAGKSYSDDMIIAQLGLAVDVIVPFREQAGTYEIGEVWLAPEAARRGQDFRELLGGR